MGLCNLLRATSRPTPTSIRRAAAQRAALLIPLPSPSDTRLGASLSLATLVNPARSAAESRYEAGVGRLRLRTIQAGDAGFRAPSVERGA